MTYPDRPTYRPPTQRPPARDPGGREDDRSVTWRSVYKNAAKDFETEGTELFNFTDKKLTDMERIGDFAGFDDIGNKFKEGYGVAVRNFIRYISAIASDQPEVGAYKQYGKRLRQMAVNNEAADWASMVPLPKVAKGPTYTPFRVEKGKIISGGSVNPGA